MIDEHELSTLLELSEPPGGAPPLGAVVHRGRRLRLRRQVSKAVSVVAAAALVVGVARALPAPTQQIRTASMPGGDVPAPGAGGTTPTTAGTGAPATTTTTAKPEPPKTGTPYPTTTTTTGPAAGAGHEPTTPTTYPTPTTSTTIPHSTVPTTNGSLAALVADGLSPAFDPGTKYYTATATNDAITVTATLADPNAN